MDGLALFKGLLEGRLPAPPLSRVLGFKVTEVEFGRAMTDKTGPVRAEGKVINVGSRIATSEARLADGSGKLLAHGTTTCRIFPI